MATLLPGLEAEGDETPLPPQHGLGEPGRALVTRASPGFGTERVTDDPRHAPARAGVPGPRGLFSFPSLTLWPPGGSVKRQHPSRNLLLAQARPSWSAARTRAPASHSRHPRGVFAYTLSPAGCSARTAGRHALGRASTMWLVNSQQSKRPGLAIAWP